MDGRLHVYHPQRKLALFEFRAPVHHAESSTVQAHTSTSFSTTVNVLLWIGGLFDNLRATGYVDDLAKLFSFSSNYSSAHLADDVYEHEKTEHRSFRNRTPRWVLMQVQLSSAMRGWGVSDLDRDAEEIGTAVEFIRHDIYGVPRLGRKPVQTPSSQDSSSTKNVNIVLMGHSTGCQNVIHYLYTSRSSRSRPPIQGAILQAPVSDREMLIHSIKTSPDLAHVYEKCQSIITQTPRSEYKTTVLPLHYTIPLWGAKVPMSIHRFLSMLSPDSPSNPQDDDLFSRDLTDDRIKSTIGRAGNTISTTHISPTHQTHNSSPEKDKSASTKKRHGRGLLLFFSARDEYVIQPDTQADQLHRWTRLCGEEAIHPFSRVLKESNHDLSDDQPQTPSEFDQDSKDAGNGSSASMGGNEKKTSEHDRLVTMRATLVDYLEDMLRPFPSSGDDDTTPRSDTEEEEVRKIFERDIAAMRGIINLDRARLAVRGQRVERPEGSLPNRIGDGVSAVLDKVKDLKL